jgi:hypothetical protein
MKITIEAETDAEKALPLFKEPWVRTGCLRFGLSGFGDQVEGNPTGEFGFLHGDAESILADLARITASLNRQTMQQATVNGTLQAYKIMSDAQRDQAIAAEVRNGRGLRIHRP